MLDSCPVRESVLEDSAATPLPASLRTGCADRKRVRPLLVGRNWRQGSLEETKPAWRDSSQLLGRAFGPAVTDGILSLLTDAELS